MELTINTILVEMQSQKHPDKSETLVVAARVSLERALRLYAVGGFGAPGALGALGLPGAAGAPGAPGATLAGCFKPSRYGVKSHLQKGHALSTIPPMA